MRSRVHAWMSTVDSPRLRVGIFGGSFDPPHLGHAMVSTWALVTLPIDELWWVPTYQHAFGKRSSDFELRAELCERALRHFRDVRLSRIEAELGGESRTIDTLEALGERFESVDFALVIGADLLDELPSWKRYEDLCRFPIHVVGRGSLAGIGASGAGPPLSIPDVSSSAVRAAFARGDDEFVGRWVDREVVASVNAAGLYSGRSG